MTMVVDGHTGIEHSIPMARIYDDVLQFWPKTRSGYTPTLIVGYGGLVGRELLVPAHERLGERAAAARSRRARSWTRARGGATMAPDDDFNHFHIARGAKQLIDAA